MNDPKTRVAPWPSVPFLLLLAALVPYPATAQSEAPPAANPLEDARALVRSGSYDEAAELLSGVEGELAGDAGYLGLYGEVLLAAGRPGEAIPILEQAIAADPERERLNFQLASARSATGDAEGAVAAFAREIEVSEDETLLRMAHLNSFVLLRDQRKWLDSAAHLEQALALGDVQPVACGDLAVLYLEAGDAARAADALDRGAELGFREASLFFNVGARLFNDGEYERAESMFSQSIAADPEMARAERSLASTLQKLERTQDAAAHWRRYLELVPDAADAEQIRAGLEAGADPGL